MKTFEFILFIISIILIVTGLEPFDLRIIASGCVVGFISVLVHDDKREIS